jgi:uncharacterized protein YlxP (DUF503 family)
MPTFVGICEMKLSLPGNDSLKGKRQILKSITERSRNRFNCSFAEVAENDRHEKATLAFSVVGNDKSFVNSAIDKIIDFVEEMNIAVIIDSEYDIIQF